MKFNIYKDIQLMYRNTYEILSQNEVLNAILLGNLILGNKGEDKRGWRDTTNWFMATVTKNSKIKLIALMTPPFNLTLYEVERDEISLRCLIDGIISNEINIPGIMCEKGLAERFAKEYSTKLKLNYRIIVNQGIYELEKLKPKLNFIGELRPFKETDWSFIPYWIESALSDFHDNPINQVSSEIKNYAQTSGLYILEENGICVSMARITREMETCCCVSMVYTPPYFRNRGYATSAVAKISKIILERGFSKCVLYTDLDYSVSNSIYKKIGFVQVYDSSEIKFHNKE